MNAVKALPDAGYKFREELGYYVQNVRAFPVADDHHGRLVLYLEGELVETARAWNIFVTSGRFGAAQFHAERRTNR